MKQREKTIRVFRTNFKKSDHTHQTRPGSLGSLGSFSRGKRRRRCLCLYTKKEKESESFQAFSLYNTFAPFLVSLSRIFLSLPLSRSLFANFFVVVLSYRLGVFFL